MTTASPAELHVRLAELHRQLAEVHAELASTLDARPVANAKRAAPAPSRRTPKTMTMRATVRGCVVRVGSAAILIRPSIMSTTLSALSQGLDYFVEQGRTADYVVSSGPAGRSYKVLAPRKDGTRAPPALGSVVLVRADHVVIGAGRALVHLTHKDARDLRAHLEAT